MERGGVVLSAHGRPKPSKVLHGIRKEELASLKRLTPSERLEQALILSETLLELQTAAEETRRAPRPPRV